MAKTTAYSVKGLVQWRSITDYRAFQRRLERNLERATRLNALAAVRTMRSVIQRGGFKPNAPLTVAIKGSNKPLVGGGDMFQSITTQDVPGGIFVGVLRTDDGFDVVRIVHNGVVIPVTPAMRWMFLLLANASSGKGDPSKLEGRAAELFSKFQGWKPLSEGTSSIVIPERPFVTVTFGRADLQALCKKNWAEAVQAAFNPRRRATKLSKLGKKAMKLGKKASKLGKKSGKKALKSISKSGKRLGRKAGKKLRSVRTSVKKFSKRTAKRFRSKGKGKKR